MLDFLKNYWDESLSILAIIVALLPAIINIVVNWFCKMYCVFLDEHFVYNVNNAKIIKEGKFVSQNGCVLILALNMFLYGRSFFPYKITCKLKFKKGSEIISKMYEGGIGYSDTNNPPQNHVFKFDNELNMNTNRLIVSNKDNLRIIPFFLDDVNIQNLENVKKVVIKFHGHILKKKLVLLPSQCVYTNLIHKYDEIVNEK